MLVCIIHREGGALGRFFSRLIKNYNHREQRFLLRLKAGGLRAVERMIIAIDGPSGTGKSTVARLLAETLGILYFNTGGLYRAFALYIRWCGINPSDREGMNKGLDSFADSIEITPDGRYLIESEDVTDELFINEISELTSQISLFGYVREKLLPIQKRFAHTHDVVFEGRDLGTVVFPEADYKFFLTAAAEERARRRLRELQEKYPTAEWNFDAILAQIQSRDMRDSGREIAPLKKASDAHEIDTTDKSVREVVQTMLKVIRA